MGRIFEKRKHSIFKTALQNSKLYSRYSKQLYVAAKKGVPDPAANPVLRSIVERAKRDNVPSHVIEKAIQKAAGKGGEDFQPARYEGFGPGGVHSRTVVPSKSLLSSIVAEAFPREGEGAPMNFRFGSKSGEAVPALDQSLLDIQAHLAQQQQLWADQLARDPAAFAHLEQQVHQTFQRLADRCTAGLLAHAGQQAALADAAAKK